MEINFLELKHDRITVVEYESKFTELSRFVREFMNTKEKKARRFQLDLKQWIQNRVSMLELTNYAILVQKASIVEAGSVQSLKEKESAFQPLWGFRPGDTVVGSTKHAWDWSYHSVTPKDFTDVVATPDLERIKLMGAQSLASSNAYFQGAVRQAESWKRASDKADNALRRQQKKYATLEKKLKRKEEELGESNAELVVLRAEKDKAIDNYLDSEEFAQSMRIRDDSVFPGFFRTGWDTALGTVNEACPDINPADYICPDDEALLQRFRTRVVVSDHVPQDPLLPPPESSSRPAEDDNSSSSSETTETSNSVSRALVRIRLLLVRDRASDIFIHAALVV
ncbi:uncharacterized protein LOC141665568 [Apium graveolens]|uniref:uncharacterized protein LOC141665568 n=1 Tax=Apium graveolens TaxID=4045 RepID=UPI003D7C0D78